MAKVFVVKKSQIFEAVELDKIAKKLVKLDLNIIVFGLPQSGKSTIIKAICKKSKEFDTLEEEEAMEEAHAAELRREVAGKKWAVSHQLPTMDENVPDSYLESFLVERIGLNPKKWAITRIKTQ